MRPSLIIIGLLVGMLLGEVSSSLVRAAETVPMDFARDVYPILQRACFECHGPEKQEGKLRLDRREFAFHDRKIIAKGNALQSELVRRIRLPAGHDEIMPNRGAPLSKEEIARIVNWVNAGADWPANLVPQKHWAYVPPVRTEPPVVKDDAGRASTNPIDAWVLKRLHQEGWSFAPPAGKATLIRRVSLDLIGLPPTPAEVDEFVRDESPAAYERLVDRLLQSPQYGVRWARPWLDYARYADSHGFQRDDFRDLWPYRDWVVTALNKDMPFTQFTIEQLAGDLLPDSTESQRVATGFNRSAPTNVEAGSDPEETRVNQIHDRINTLGMIWLGTTLECAQCHDHKYDPITQRDYYGLFAFFNNTALEADRANPKVPGSIRFQGPMLELANEDITERQQKLRVRLDAVNAEIALLSKGVESGWEEWETLQQANLRQKSEEHVAEIVSFESSGGSTHELLPDGSVLLSGEPAPDKDNYTVKVRTSKRGVTGIKLETLTHDSLPGKGPGRGDAERPNFVLNNLIVTAAPATDPAKGVPVTFTSARASFSQANYPVANLLKTGNAVKGGWAIGPRFHDPHWAVLSTATPFGFEDGTVLTVKLEQKFGSGRTIGRLRISVLTGASDHASLPADVAEALATEADKRTPKQKQTLVSFRLKDVPKFVALDQEKSQLEKRLQGLKFPSTLVVREDTSRTTTLFQRGDFRSPGTVVEPGTPQVLHPFRLSNESTSESSSRRPTRLELAQWLVSRENPLVARVVVNRWWMELFGQGLVTTPEDFGIKGDRPSHPELLDGLASEFMDQGWSQKRLLKTIVMSTVYQQSSRTIPQRAAEDDRNRLLWRGPRHRLDAEMIRDNALSIAGLLKPKLGGSPIRPYQPEGLWIKVGGQRYEYEVSPGDEQHRRGLYVVLKRAAPYPSFVNFDANNRMACRVKRPRSNTPLQALTLMNDPVYVEAAKSFAKRVLTEKPDADDATRLQHAFRLAVSRPMDAAELKILTELLTAERAARAANAKDASEFVGKFALPKGVSAVEFTAWTAIMTTLLNLDETITKG